MLTGKKIVLGITGSIAAYKAAYLIRLLRKARAEIKVVATPAAGDFVSSLTFSTLSCNEVHSEFADSKGNWDNHVALAEWADLFIVAPATANTLAKMANGLCDNLLLAVYLSSKSEVVLSPAMDLDMWKHPSTQRNIETLKKDGCQIIDVGFGELASGLVGEGRMAEPESILTWVENFFSNKKKSPERRRPLNGKTALVTAGPTRESLDPARFLSNPSTGKMGIAIAETLAELGAEVVLVKGPTPLKANHHSIDELTVTSAAEMHEVCMTQFPKSDIAVMAAAVADLTPARFSDKKLKKEAFGNSEAASENISIQFKKTKDILSGLGKLKTPEQVLVGFALETNDALENAKRKLKTKNCDLIILNSLNDEGAGFQHDTNKISILNRAEKITTFDLKSKKQVASDIVNEIINLLHD